MRVLQSLQNQIDQRDPLASASAVADRIEANPKGPIQATLFSEDYGAVPEIKGRSRARTAKKGLGAEVPDEHLAARYTFYFQEGGKS